ncbi:MAG: bifunctional demethylmenaquinone methyltransferase/2-methoxy-6-polyprenyl-1,4-benzoquinol methylase UbiE [Deltaproteobacteria bacterium]|nr:bifunctional demethylmenaquinone methyltransferase/2-methoxy-6-polyprenyl-1,4-benzoquinol methylase UbiE [Deltaproteobacteria bacterium]
MPEDKKTYFGSRLIPEDEKKDRVDEIFTSVAARYDLMNDIMSLGTHRLWKRYVAARTGLRQGDRALDVAGGTADIALLMAEKVGDGGGVVVYDINREMLNLGRDKCTDRGFLKNVRFVQGDAETIAFDDNTFHCVTIGFGIRNVTRLDRAFREMTRVAKPGGKVICLEFSSVRNPLLRKLYDLYSVNFIPFAGSAITGNRDAYVYLHESIRKFPDQEKLKGIMEEAGLYGVSYSNLFDGIAAVHIGTKV